MSRFLPVNHPADDEVPAPTTVVVCDTKTCGKLAVMESAVKFATEWFASGVAGSNAGTF
jgi:hypothetical protein